MSRHRVQNRAGQEGLGAGRYAGLFCQEAAAAAATAAVARSCHLGCLCIRAPR
jgi:hypothetical protein